MSLSRRAIAVAVAWTAACSGSAPRPPEPAPVAIAEPDAVALSCEARDRGASVAFGSYDLPRACGAAARAEDHTVEAAEPSLHVIAGEPDFRAELGCGSGGAIDFARERLAAYWYVRNSADQYGLSDVVRTPDGSIVLVFDVRQRCQGMVQRAHQGARFVRIPQGTEPVRVALCRHQDACGALPP